VYSSVPAVINNNNVLDRTFIWLGSTTIWSSGASTGYFVQAVLRMTASCWRVEFWIIGANVQQLTDLCISSTTSSWVWYSIEINPNNGAVTMIISDSNGNSRTFIDNAKTMVTTLIGQGQWLNHMIIVCKISQWTGR